MAWRVRPIFTASVARIRVRNSIRYQDTALLPAMVRAMMNPGFYADGSNKVELRQTHISYVLLTDDWVYKIKKPVRFPFLDCLRLERRYFFCAEEVRLNSRLSPSVYLGVFAIFKHHDRFVLGPRVEQEHPEAVEYAVKMRRLPDDRMLDRMVARGLVDARVIRSIAARIAQFHSGATQSGAQTYSSAAALWGGMISEIAQNERFVGHSLEQKQFAAIDGFCRSFISSHWRLLDDRVRTGRVREGHGDLRAEHICLNAGGIEVIDCVEFSEGLRYSDVASEIAFLAMDLERLQAAPLAEQLVEAYAELTGDEDLPLLVPFYKCCRACVRGKVESLRSLEQEIGAEAQAEARQLARGYFALASGYAQACAPALIVICGLSGTGKSTIARMLQHRTGFQILNSDRVRKQLAGVSPHDHPHSPYKEGMYSDGFSKMTYDAMLAGAGKLLESGRGAIIDATFKSSADRLKAFALAADLRLPVIFVECVVSTEEIARRLIQRAKEADDEVSDATVEIHELQRAEFEPIVEIPARNHLTIDNARESRERIIPRIETALLHLGQAIRDAKDSDRA
jgi:aminoglycoside phosphotransferase family enzyme/predicted kinase